MEYGKIAISNVCTHVKAEKEVGFVCMESYIRL